MIRGLYAITPDWDDTGKLVEAVAESLAGIPTEVLRRRAPDRLLGHAYDNLARDYYEL